MSTVGGELLGKSGTQASLGGDAPVLLYHAPLIISGNAIGAGGRLVGRSQWDLWPDSARLVPALGPGIRPNVEAVLAARPDLVLLYASEDNRPPATRLQAAGIPIFGRPHSSL